MTDRSVWALEQLSSAIGRGAMALVRQLTTAGSRQISKYEYIIPRLSIKVLMTNTHGCCQFMHAAKKKQLLAAIQNTPTACHTCSFPLYCLPQEVIYVRNTQYIIYKTTKVSQLICQQRSILQVRPRMVVLAGGWSPTKIFKHSQNYFMGLYLCYTISLLDCCCLLLKMPMMMDQTNIYREVILTNVCYKLYQRRTIQEKNKENKWK